MDKIQNWIDTNLKRQDGKVFLVTGANSGIGYAIAKYLGSLGARVIITCRDEIKLEKTLNSLSGNGIDKEMVSGGVLDLASLQSVRDFANNFIKTNDRLDVLINNAGVMAPPPSKTVEGFELQFGVNFIGHFALTGHLFNLLRNTDNSRVVTLSSLAHRGGRIDFSNLKLEKPYDQRREYGQSKMADVIFTMELQRRISLEKLKMLAVTAHPGISHTGLLRNIDPSFIKQFDAMPAEQGALPALYAATSILVKGGEYYGPDGVDEINGFPALAYTDTYATNRGVGHDLWKLAEDSTGCKFP